MKTISVVGAGYVGLVSAACFAKKGIKVIVVENDPEKIKTLRKGRPHFFEPGLEELVTEGIKNNCLQFVTSIAEALFENPEILFSCVGTPSLPDGSVDLSYVRSVAKEVGKHLTNYTLVVNKSTVPVGAAQEVKAIIAEELRKRNLEVEFEVASNPEFLKEGTAVNDSIYPDRVVVGVSSKKAEKLLHGLYKPFIEKDDQFMVMNCESSELTKYASNAMLATRISFMNQLALLADKVGADVSQVKRGMSYDKRIGAEFLNAGIGYGGSCFPKDVKALVSMGEKHEQPMSIVKEVDSANDKQRKWFVDEICNCYKENIVGKKAAILGLAFKPDTDDIRCAPSINVISKLLEKGVHIIAYDPVAMDNIKEIFGQKISFATCAEDALKGADFAVVLTEWEEFKEINLHFWKNLKDKLVFDARNCLDLSTITSGGVQYFCVGRNSFLRKIASNIISTSGENNKEVNSFKCFVGDVSGQSDSGAIEKI